MEFKFTLTEKNKRCIIKLSGNLMEKNQATDLLDETAAMINRDVNYFILDFSEFNYMNSSGLSVMLNIITRARKAGGDAVICSIPEQLKSLLHITKLSEVFTIVNSIEDAPVHV